MIEFNPYPSEDTEQVAPRAVRDPWDTPTGYRMAWYEWALAFLAAVLLVWFCWCFTAQAMGYEPVAVAQSSWTAMWGGR